MLRTHSTRPNTLSARLRGSQGQKPGAVKMVTVAEGGQSRGRGGIHFVDFFSYFTINDALLKDGAPFLLAIDTSNIWALSTFLPHIT